MPRRRLGQSKGASSDSPSEDPLLRDASPVLRPSTRRRPGAGGNHRRVLSIELIHFAQVVHLPRVQILCVEPAKRVVEQSDRPIPTATTDRVCQTCEAGTFNTTANAVSCTGWATCNAGTYVSNAPSATLDRVCGK